MSVWTCIKKTLCSPFVKGQISDVRVTDCHKCFSYRSNGMFCDLQLVKDSLYKCSACGNTYLASADAKIKCGRNDVSVSPETDIQPEVDTLDPLDNEPLPDEH